MCVFVVWGGVLSESSSFLATDAVNSHWTLFLGVTRELWGTPSQPFYTTTIRKNHWRLRAPTRSRHLSMSLKTLTSSDAFYQVDICWRFNASFSNILKATVNDEVLLESGSLTRSQKNFSSISSPSKNRSPVTTQRGSPVAARRREATEEEAERSDP